MLSDFENYLKLQTGLPDDAIQTVSGMAELRTLSRNEQLLTAGDICRHKVFVIYGLLRTFSTGTNGNEHILQFSPENTWTLDVESYDKQIPSLVTIEAIEPSEVLLWQRDNFNKILHDFPLLRQFSEQLIARNVHYSRQRIIMSLGATPEEKYEDFVRTFPDYLNRLPLRMIAGYLGISVKTLTRLRHAQLHR